MSDVSHFNIIGHIKSCYPEKFGIPRQSGIVNSVVSELVIQHTWQPEIALQGLEGFSHIWILFIFHLNNESRYHAKVHPPRLDGASTGVFSTRSPHRPNPIGLSLVQIKEIKSDRIIFYGGDLVDGTPVVDVKPYLPQFESKPDASTGWSLRDPRKAIRVSFSASALERVNGWMSEVGDHQIKTAIEEIIQQDPRPVVYKGYEARESPHRNRHAFRLYNADVHFEFSSQDEAVVIDIQF